MTRTHIEQALRGTRTFDLDLAINSICEEIK